MKTWKFVGVNFDHMHMGDLLRMAHAHPRINIVGVADRDPARAAKVAGPFDLIFQDGHKLLYGPLLDPLVKRLRPGGLLVTDNVLWDGDVVPGFNETPHRGAEETRAIADYNVRISEHPELLTSIVPLRDGVAISVKR